MNYGVYTYRVVDGQDECQFVAYKLGTDNGVNGVSLMTQADANTLATSYKATPGITVMVLPLSTDQEITAF
jgi:hypothetical protein